MKILLATIEDCKELSILKRKMWYDTYKDIYPDEKINHFDYADHAQKFEKLVKTDNQYLYVVKDNNEIIAYMCYGTPIRKFRNYKQDISLLYIRTDYQGKGLGRKLYNIAKQGIVENGERKFFISCNKYNTNARCFYEKMGGVKIYENDDKNDKSNSQVKYLFQL